MITQVVPTRKRMKIRSPQRGRRRSTMKTIRTTGRKAQMKDVITLQKTRRRRRRKRSSDHTETARGRKKKKIIGQMARKSTKMRPRINNTL
jgi:hypothetical protein